MFAFGVVDQKHGLFSNGDQCFFCFHQGVSVFKSAAGDTERAGGDKGYIGRVLCQAVRRISHDGFGSMEKKPAYHVCLNIFL